MHPFKCFFRVASRKLLGFIIQKDGIQLDPAKVNAILEMPSPFTIKELKSLQGKSASNRRFISNLVGRCRPFSELIKKGVTFEWGLECEATFGHLKEYLM